MSEAKSVALQTRGRGAGVMDLMARRVARLIEKVGGRRGVDGFVDRVLAGEVIGWAFDPKKPHRRVHIVARCDGKIVAEALADLPRKDLAQSGKGDGRHGFNLRLPASLFDGAPRKVRVEVGGGPARRLLIGGAITVAAKRPAAAPPPPARPTPSHGVLESVSQGVLTGWAAHPRNGGTPAVVDVYDDERYLGSVTAERPRPGLRESGAPSGALGFQFRLPPTAEEAAVRRLRARIAGTRFDLVRAADFPGASSDPRPSEEDAALVAPTATTLPPAPARRAEPARPAQRQIALLVVGEAGEDRMRHVVNAWAAQNWPALAIGAAGPQGAAADGEHRFGADDEDRLRAFLGQAHTVVLARAGETLDPALARAVAVGRPLCDVLTWERAAATRRDADRLAVLLGEAAGAFAVRGHMIAAYPGRLAAELAGGDMRGFEYWLAANPSARWGRLAGALSHGPQAPAVDRPTAQHRPARITLAVWPAWSTASLASLEALAAAAPEGCDLEILAPAGAPIAQIEAGLRDIAPGRRLTVRPVDAPRTDAAGGWLRALGEAASGDVVVLCRAGVRLEPRPNALTDVCGWALHPLAGPVTIAVTAEEEQPLAGLALRLATSGWAVASAYAAALEGRARPILAAPGAFMALDRAKLAAAGGFDAERFPDEGADIDLALRLRRTGRAGVLLGDLRAVDDAKAPAASCAQAALALLDIDELAAAADAYPAPPDALA
jgi:hypothetical protein